MSQPHAKLAQKLTAKLRTSATLDVFFAPRTIRNGSLFRPFTSFTIIPQNYLLDRQNLYYPASFATRLYSTQPKIDKPTYQLTFTCKACSKRSSHLVSKQAYHNGTVLIQCPECKNRHLIADHLNVFGHGKKTLEDLLKENGSDEKITHRTIDPNQPGDIEWETKDEPLQLDTSNKN